MKIRCPICKTSYQVNLPNLTAKGVAVECAKCHNKFVVKPEAQEPPPTPAEPQKVQPKITQEEAKPEPITTPEIPEPATGEADDSLNDFLDQLIQQEAQKEKAPLETKKETVASGEPESMDNLFDNFVGGDFTADMAGTSADTIAEPPKKA